MPPSIRRARDALRCHVADSMDPKVVNILMRIVLALVIFWNLAMLIIGLNVGIGMNYNWREDWSRNATPLLRYPSGVGPGLVGTPLARARVFFFWVTIPFFLSATSAYDRYLLRKGQLHQPWAALSALAGFILYGLDLHLQGNCMFQFKSYSGSTYCPFWFYGLLWPENKSASHISGAKVALAWYSAQLNIGGMVLYALSFLLGLVLLKRRSKRSDKDSPKDAENWELPVKNETSITQEEHVETYAETLCRPLPEELEPRRFEPNRVDEDSIVTATESLPPYDRGSFQHSEDSKKSSLKGGFI